MNETMMDSLREKVINISVYTDKRSILINGLKNVIIRPEHE